MLNSLSHWRHRGGDVSSATTHPGDGLASTSPLQQRQQQPAAAQAAQQSQPLSSTATGRYHWQRCVPTSRGRRLACVGAVLLLLLVAVVLAGVLVPTLLHRRQQTGVFLDSAAGLTPSTNQQLPAAPPASAPTVLPAAASGPIAAAARGGDAAPQPQPPDNTAPPLAAAPPDNTAVTSGSSSATGNVSSTTSASISTTNNNTTTTPAASNATAPAKVQCTHAAGDRAAFGRINAQLHLVRGCSDTRQLLVGFNNYQLAMAAGVVSPKAFQTVGGLSGRQAVTRLMEQAAARGLNVVRTWAHSSDTQFPFQIAPGVYLEAALAGLDHVVAAAAAAGLSLVLSLADNWKYAGGVDQYVDWSPTAPPRTRTRPPDTPGDPTGVKVGPPAAPGSSSSSSSSSRNASGATQDQQQQQQQQQLLEGLRYEAARHALFFSDAGARELYRRHAAAVVMRRSTLTGRLYRDEPAILAWSLVNEPRCEVWAAPNCTAAVQAWVEEMSAHVRALDPNHLITIGSEGFFGPSTPHLIRHNPGGDGGVWAAGLGQDWVANNAAPHIDFASLHAWPDNWVDTEQLVGDGSAEDGAGESSSIRPKLRRQLPPPSAVAGAAAGAAPAAAAAQRYAAFMADWLTSHLAAAAELLHKPVLLDEFGKKVEPGSSSNSGGSSTRERELSEQGARLSAAAPLPGPAVAEAGLAAVANADQTSVPPPVPKAAAAVPPAVGNTTVVAAPRLADVAGPQTLTATGATPAAPAPKPQPAGALVGAAAGSPGGSEAAAAGPGSGGARQGQAAAVAAGAAAIDARKSAERDAVYNQTYRFLDELLRPSLPLLPPAPPAPAPVPVAAAAPAPPMPSAPQPHAQPAARSSTNAPNGARSAAVALRGLRSAPAPAAAGVEMPPTPLPQPPPLSMSVTVGGVPVAAASSTNSNLSTSNSSSAERPLLGSLFWMWQLPLFVGEAPDPYGVSGVDDTLFKLVTSHAANLSRLQRRGSPSADSIIAPDDRLQPQLPEPTPAEEALGRDSHALPALCECRCWNSAVAAAASPHLLNSSSSDSVCYSADIGGGSGDDRGRGSLTVGPAADEAVAAPAVAVITQAEMLRARNSSDGAAAPTPAGSAFNGANSQPQLQPQLLPAGLTMLRARVQEAGEVQALLQPLEPGACEQQLLRSALALLSAEEEALAAAGGGPAAGQHLVMYAAGPQQQQQQQQQALRTYLQRRCRSGGTASGGGGGGGAPRDSSRSAGAGAATLPKAAAASSSTAPSAAAQPPAPAPKQQQVASTGAGHRRRGLLEKVGGMAAAPGMTQGSGAADAAGSPAFNMGACLRLWVRSMCSQSSVRSAVAYSNDAGAVAGGEDAARRADGR